MTRTAADIRREFLEFFREREHAVVDSASVIPYDDPTILFTNAGMNQFKDVFLGTGSRNYLRAADTQPCIRAGGKHNDLDDVGRDTYHHTLFEMLGNWSFGDYFKKEAISWAWELLTEKWGLDGSRLYATYFGGSGSIGELPAKPGDPELEPDLEAKELWASETGIDPTHIVPGNMKDNFWEMGDTGPCGPCSEIHIDLTPDKSGGPLVNAGVQEVIEIWNLVFIQFNRGADGKLTPLPSKHVDTGMGLERVSAVLQKHNNNYATDVFLPIIQAIEQMTGHVYGVGIEGLRDEGIEGARPASIAEQSPNHQIAKSPDHEITNSPDRYAIFRPDNMQDIACRVIADHIRALTFAISDGCLPDREGRGYVLRRILRRAVRYGWQHLGLREPFLCELASVVVEVMGEAFPHLADKSQQLRDVLRDEEQSFNRTLDRGISLFQQAAERARQRTSDQRTSDQSRDRKGAVAGHAPDRADAASPNPDADVATPATNALAYFITFHTYGTWMHGSEQGSVDHLHNQFGQPTLDPDPGREQAESAHARQDALLLDTPRRLAVDASIREVCEHRHWTLHELNVRSNHVHVVVSAPVPPERVMGDFKSYATRRLRSDGFVKESDKVWTRHGSTRYLWKPDALVDACNYVRDAQGGDLDNTGGSPDEASAGLRELTKGRKSVRQPLPDGRGSDRNEHASDQSRDRKGAVAGHAPDREDASSDQSRDRKGAVAGTRPTDTQAAPPDPRDSASGPRPESRESVRQPLPDGRGSDRNVPTVSGADAFKLHDTYGFPIDLTRIMAEEKGLRVDIEEYERLMAEARERARGRPSNLEDDEYDLAPGECDDVPKYEDWRECRARIASIARQAGTRESDCAKRGERIVFSTDRTNFYAEQGGQVSDKGWVRTDTGVIRVDRVVRRVDSMQLSDGPRSVQFFAHSGEVIEGEIHSGQKCRLSVDPAHRIPTMQNHTATHVMNWALREVLGEHVQQRGSLVDPEKTRFDLSQPKAITSEQITRIERLVNQRIAENLTVYADEADQADALKINGLRAVFGEKYPDRVRVVSIGAPVKELIAKPDNPEWRRYSIEFCGGTHVRSTGEIEKFVITAEEAVAKGVRRVVGITGEAARKAQAEGEALLSRAEALLDEIRCMDAPRTSEGARTSKEPRASVRADSRDANGAAVGEPRGPRTAALHAERAAALQQEITSASIPLSLRQRARDTLTQVQEALKQQHKKDAVAAADVVNAIIDELLGTVERVGEAAIVVAQLPDAPVEQLKQGADRVKQKCGSAAILFGVHVGAPPVSEPEAQARDKPSGGKALLLAAMTPDLIKKGLKAGDLVREVARIVGGGGGGPPTMAQAGGKTPEKLAEALAAGERWIRERLG